jgi:hypothetical protein
MAALAFFAGTVLPRTAQAQGRPELKRPENTPQEKPPTPPKKKPVKGPRAVGILQLTAGGKGTLIPVAILIDGKFYDASEYKADPVPMALDSGTVYEVEQGGDSQGLFTVSGALHSKNQGSANPWVGAGSFLPAGTEAEKATRKAEDVPVGINGDDNDAPPRLARGGAAKPAVVPNPAPAAPSGTAASSAPAGTAASAPSSNPAGTGAAEKPATTAPPASSPPVNGSAAGTAAGQDASKAATPAAGQAQQGQAQQGQAESYYRPTLRRGKPTEAPPPDEEEAALKAGKAASAAAGAASVAASVTTAGPVQLVPAISDAGGPDPKSYKFFWKEGEEDERHNQMLALAGDEVRAYANALVKNRIPANPPAATKQKAAAGRKPLTKPAAKPAQPVLENVQFHAFDVWVNNQVVMILTADAHFPSPPGTDAPPEQYSIALVARTDIYGNLRKLYSGVTDKFHLDVTPRLELIDVVDADGDGRGELLFRETTDAGTGYLIYRATADKLWKMFDSLGS